ncbi:MAG: DctP family TRAP transporter solute-binding subunit [Alphaproteobacteria bacterium]|nr:DctP family TRAP transporter solute-binding subunit [Alphaproteobacteria bacterium]
MNKLIKIAASATLIAGLSMSFAAQAQIRDQNFKLGVQVGLDNARGYTIEKFANLVKQKSGGKMNVQIFPGGALGGDLQTIAALRGGTVDATATATSTLVGIVKDFALLDLPFVFKSNEEAMAVLDNGFAKRLNTLLDEKDLVGLGYWGAGYRHLTNNKRPVKTPDDVKGLKIRVLQNPLFIDLWKALGANAVPMPFPEVYSALEQGTVDGQENPAATLVSAKLFEVQKFLSLTSHVYFVDSLLFSKPVWAKLNADERKVLTDAAKEAEAFGRVEVIGEDKANIDAMRAKMQINEISAADMDKFAALAKPVVDKYSASNEQPAAKELFEIIAKVRK